MSRDLTIALQLRQQGETPSLKNNKRIARVFCVAINCLFNDCKPDASRHTHVHVHSHSLSEQFGTGYKEPKNVQSFASGFLIPGIISRK